MTPLGFVFPFLPQRAPGRWLLQAGLAVFDALAGQWRRHFQPVDARLHSHIAQAGLEGAMCCQDAKPMTRLVLRVLQEAQALGAVAVNYLAADDELLRDSTGLQKWRACARCARWSGHHRALPAGRERHRCLG